MVASRFVLLASSCLAVLGGVVGCAVVPPRTEPETPPPASTAKVDAAVQPAIHLHHHNNDTAALHAPVPVPGGGAAMPPPLEELSGPRPVDELIHRALAENRTVRAARFNVLSLQHRIPQVTTLDDPVVSNTIFPIPSVAPQYSLMGYMPYDALLAQQFPWFGTLRLRGQVAQEDVKVALMELAAAQLDTVAAVKRAYHDLHYSERAEALLRENRAIAVDFLAIAKQRYLTATATQADVLRASVALSDIDRELENAQQGSAEARAELARQLHISPESDLRTLDVLPPVDVPAEVQRLYQLAAASRPDLRGRLAAIARDEKAIALAQKRFYPNVTVGVVYQDMERRNAMTPATAGGMPNLGLFVGFNLPVYRGKYRAGVCEAQARRAADIQLYEDERDQGLRDVKDLFVQARVQQNVIRLLTENNRAAARRIFDLTASEFRAGNLGTDLLAVISAWRDVLQVELQLAQLEAELGKTLAGLERAVGTQLNLHPPDPTTAPPPPPTTPAATDPASLPPPPTSTPGAFQRAEDGAPPPPATNPAPPSHRHAG